MSVYKKAILVVLIFSMSGCAFMERTPTDIVQSLDEARSVRDAIYEFVPARFEAYRAQLGSDKAQEIDRRWELGLRVNSKDGAISIVNLKKLMARSEEVKALVNIALLKQELVDSKVGHLIEIDRKIYDKYRDYMQAGMTPEQRAMLRDQILGLVNEGVTIYAEAKRIEKEKKAAEAELQKRLEAEGEKE